MYRSLSDRGSITEYVYVLQVENRRRQRHILNFTLRLQVIRPASIPIGGVEPQGAV